MSAKPNLHAPLQIFIDAPSQKDDDFGYWGGSQVSRLLIWMLEKLTLTPEQVGINFTLKCCSSSLSKKVEKLEAIQACSFYSEKFIKVAKAIVGMGELSCLALLSKPLDKSVYQEHKKVLHCPVFISYACGYCLQKPAESVDIIRMIWRAAVAAELNPVVDLELAEFDYGQI